jgi:hypothetical protein
MFPVRALHINEDYDLNLVRKKFLYDVGCLWKFVNFDFIIVYII